MCDFVAGFVSVFWVSLLTHVNFGQASLTFIEAPPLTFHITSILRPTSEVAHCILVILAGSLSLGRSLSFLSAGGGGSDPRADECSLPAPIRFCEDISLLA